jgi:alkyl hydroperoxide reductase subunit AhpC
VLSKNSAANGDASKRSASDNQTVRTVFVISPDKNIQLILVYPMTTGRKSAASAPTISSCSVRFICVVS